MRTQSVPESLPVLDRVNRRAYQHRGMLRQFGGASGWLEPGEQRAFAQAADAARGLPVLDIGVGGGRTAPLLREISADYRGIDYVPAMVALARQRFPGVAFLQMDARALTFPDATFGLVAFTYNGIDSVDLAGRVRILLEVSRVLRPGGYFVFSSLNSRTAPAARQWPDWSVFHAAGRSPARLLRGCARLLLGGANRLRLGRLARAGGELAVGQISAHNFGLITMFVSVREQVRELDAAGLRVEAIFAPDGTPVLPDADSAAPWCHYVARKPAAAVVH